MPSYFSVVIVSASSLTIFFGRKVLCSPLYLCWTGGAIFFSKLKAWFWDRQLSNFVTFSKTAPKYSSTKDKLGFIWWKYSGTILEYCWVFSNIHLIYPIFSLCGVRFVRSFFIGWNLCWNTQIQHHKNVPWICRRPLKNLSKAPFSKARLWSLCHRIDIILKTKCGEVGHEIIRKMLNEIISYKIWKFIQFSIQ